MQAKARELHHLFSMEWLTWYPSIHWQHAALAFALFIVLIAMLMSVRRRSRPDSRKPI